MEPQTNFYTHLYRNKHMLPELCKIFFLTCQPCTTPDLLTVINFNISCLILVGIFCNSLSYHFQLITAKYRTKQLFNGRFILCFYICFRQWLYLSQVVVFLFILMNCQDQLNSEKEQLLDTETPLPYKKLFSAASQKLKYLLLEQVLLVVSFFVVFFPVIYCCV